MPADFELIRTTWQSLQPALAQEKCAGCECLSGALVELKLALEELPGEAGQPALLGQVETALRRGEPHACLGCEPCNPGDILATFYRYREQLPMDGDPPPPDENPSPVPSPLEGERERVRGLSERQAREAAAQPACCDG